MKRIIAYIFGLMPFAAWAQPLSVCDFANVSPIAGYIRTYCGPSLGEMWAPPPNPGSGDVIGPGSATTNDIAVFDGSTGKLLKDTGIPSANIVTGPGSAVGDHVATFNGTTGKIIKDGGIGLSGFVTGPASSVNQELAVFNGTTGKIIANTGIIQSDVMKKSSTPKTINVRDFGCVGDGVTSDDTCISSAVASIVNDSVLYFPASSGCYVVNANSPFNISAAPFVIKGDGKVVSSICKNKFTGDLFTLSGGNWIEVHDLTVVGNSGALASYTSGYAFDFTGAGGEFYVDNVNIAYLYGGVLFNNSTAIDGRVTNFNIGHFVDRGIWYAASGGGGLVGNGEILFTGTGAEAASICITLTEGDTFHLHHINCGFAGGVGIQLQPSAGKILRNVFMDSVLADSGKSDGIVINGSLTTLGLAQRFYLNNTWASTNLGSGLHLIGIQAVTLTDFHGMTNGQRGVYVDANVSGLKIVGGQFGGNSGSTYLPGSNFINDDIVLLAGTSDFTITGITAGLVAGLTQTSRRTLSIEDGASNNYVVTGNKIPAGGGGAGFYDGGTGANRVISNNLGVDDVIPTKASANNLYLGNGDNPTIFVSGTTTVKNIFIGTGGSVPCWGGQTVTIIPTGIFTLGDGTGNVGTGFATAVNTPYRGVCDTTTWRFR